MKIICANGTKGATFHVWVGKPSSLGDVDYVASMTSDVGTDLSGIRSLHLYDGDFTELMIAVDE